MHWERNHRAVLKTVKYAPRILRASHTEYTTGADEATLVLFCILPPLQAGTWEEQITYIISAADPKSLNPSVVKSAVKFPDRAEDLALEKFKTKAAFVTHPGDPQRTTV